MMASWSKNRPSSATLEACFSIPNPKTQPIETTNMPSTTLGLQQKLLAQEDAIDEWLHKKVDDLTQHGHHLAVYKRVSIGIQ
jgi:hypothetical protein